MPAMRALICLIAFATACSHREPTAITTQVRYRFDVSELRDTSKDLDDAIAAAEARPKDPLELTELANLYLARAQLGGDRRDFEASERAARESLALLPAPNGATITLAKLANARHDFHAAIELAHQYRGRNATAVPMVLATAYLALGELPAAEAAADEAVKTKPTPTTYLERALVREARGDDHGAAADFASAVRVEDYGDVAEAARVRALWARFLVRRGKYDDAGIVIGESLRLLPGNALALSIRAELELRTGDSKHARADLDRAFQAQHQVRYLIDEARALEAGGDRTAANHLRRTVEGLVRDDLATGAFGHRLELVEVLVDRGTPEEAVAIAKEELAHRPAAETHYQLARALAGTGRYDEAAAQVNAAIASGAHEPQYFELAARVARKRGEPAKLYELLADSFDPSHGAWRAIGMP